MIYSNDNLKHYLIEIINHFDSENDHVKKYRNTVYFRMSESTLLDLTDLSCSSCDKVLRRKDIELRLFCGHLYHLKCFDTDSMICKECGKGVVDDVTVSRLFQNRDQLLEKSEKSEKLLPNSIKDSIQAIVMQFNRAKVTKKPQNRTNHNQQKRKFQYPQDQYRFSGQSSNYAKGVGYGGMNDNNQNFTKQVSAARDKERSADLEMTKLVNTLSEQIEEMLEMSDQPNLIASLGQALRKQYDGTSVSDVIRFFWRNDSLMDVLLRLSVYTSFVRLFEAILKSPLLSTLHYMYFEQKADQNDESETTPQTNHVDIDEIDETEVNAKRHISQIISSQTQQNTLMFIHRLNDQAITYLGQNRPDTAEESHAISFLSRLTSVVAKTNQVLSQSPFYAPDVQLLGPLSRSKRRNLVQLTQQSDLSIEDQQRVYCESLRGLQWRTVSLLELDQLKSISYAFTGQCKPVYFPSKTRMLRIMKELSTIKTSLPLEWSSGIFLRADTDRHDVLCVLIIGPEGTPYANGGFLFDIFLPPDYPQVPPRVLFKTTGGGTVRFNPNLYKNGKVCLSLLGTWQGPGWDSHTSTLLQVLISIQSLILVDQPYFNEPGYENSIGTPQGSAQSNAYNDFIRFATMQHAIYRQIKDPDFLFKDVLDIHFRLKRAHIISQCNLWANTSQKHPAISRKITQEIVSLLSRYDVVAPVSSSVINIDEEGGLIRERESTIITIS